MTFALFLAFLPVTAAIRESVDTTALVKNPVPAGCRDAVCRPARAPSGEPRIDQGRFELSVADMRWFAWRLPYSTYGIFHSCDSPTLLTKAEVVPWISADDPINGSTVDVFINPKVVMKLQGSPPAYLCAHSPEPTCICRLDTEKDVHGYVAALVGRLPSETFGSLVELQLAMERQCPTSKIPDAALLLLVACALFVVLVFGEALWSLQCLGAASVLGPEPSENNADVIVMPPFAQLKSWTASAVGFVTLTGTTQSIAIAALTRYDAPEVVLWIMIMTTTIFALMGVWLFYTMLGRSQVIHSCLRAHVCVLESPSASGFVQLLTSFVLIYGMVVLGCVSHHVKSVADAIPVVVLLGSGMVGPLMGLLKALRVAKEEEQMAQQLQLKAADFAKMASPHEQETKWSFIRWADLIKGTKAGPADAGPGAGAAGRDFNIFRDVAWQRGAVYERTGSPAGFMVLPSCACALLVVAAVACLQGAGYACSRAGLSMLEVAGASDDLEFAPWQDRYVLDLDVAYSQAHVTAMAPSARWLQFHPSALTRQEDTKTGATSSVWLQTMPVPRVVNISVQGRRPSLPATTYSIRFAPRRKVPLLVRITDPVGTFRRCISWGALSGSQLSVPQSVDALNISVVFTDFVVGVPYPRGQKPPAAANDGTWTMFTPNTANQTCQSQCRDEPDCLQGFHGHGGCYMAYHSHSVQEARCDAVFEGAEHARNSEAVPETHSVQVQMLGCISGAAGLGLEPSQCGPNTKMTRQFADFGTVQPYWQGHLTASLGLKTVMSAEMMSLASELEYLQLKKGIPALMDVLTSLTGHAQDGTNPILNSTGIVTDEGDVVVHISEYDATQFTTLTLVVVPLLTDRAFEVEWDALPADDVLANETRLPRFKQCENSPNLQRYEACGGHASWTSQPVRFAKLSPWLSVFSPPRFSVHLARHHKSTEEAQLWTPGPTRSMQLSFQDVDAPVAWAARQHECKLLDTLEPLRAVARTSGTLCDLLTKCSTGPACKAGKMALLPGGVPPRNLLHASSCFVAKRCTGLDAKWHGNGRMSQIVIHQPRGIPVRVYGTSVTFPQLFAGLRELTAQQLAAGARQLCLMTEASWTPANLLLGAARTGNLPVFDVGADQVVEALWAGVAEAGVAFNTTQWLLAAPAAACQMLSARRCAELPRKLLETTVAAGHLVMPEARQGLQAYLHNNGQNISDLNLRFVLCGQLLTDVGPCLRNTPNVRILNLDGENCDATEAQLPIQAGAFLEAVTKMPKLEKLRIYGLQLPEPLAQGLAHALRPELHEVFLKGRPGLPPLAPAAFAALAGACVQIIHVEYLLQEPTNVTLLADTFTQSVAGGWRCLKGLYFWDKVQPAERKLLEAALGKALPKDCKVHLAS